MSHDDVAETTDASVNFDQASINGVSYTKAMVVSVDSSGTSEVQLNAARREHRFLGDLGIPDDNRSASSYKVQISLDNSAPVVAVDLHFGETKKIDLDVTNVLRIKIDVTAVNAPCCGNHTVGIGDARYE